MAKITAWLVTLIGVLLVLVELKVLTALTAYNAWIIALSVLVIGIGKIMRNYKKKRK